MLLQFIFLFIALPSFSSAECQTPLVQFLPETSFTANSSYNDSVKASNVRFTVEKPWCLPTNDEQSDEQNEYVTVDLGCPRSVCKVEGKYPCLTTYFGEHSNDSKTWKTLTSDDPTHYYYKRFEANNKAVITPSVRARFFKFRPGGYMQSQEGGPCSEVERCFKVELYSEHDPDDSVEPMGCFTEPKMRRRRRFTSVYHRVNGRVHKNYPDILAIYEACRQHAFSKSLEIFGIKNYRQCVTTKSGREGQHFIRHLRPSRSCENCNGKGIGATRRGVFVYKIKSLA